MLLSKLLEHSRNAQDAVDKLLDREPGLARKAEKLDMIFVHTYVVNSHLRRRSHKRTTLKVLKGGRA